MGEYCAGWFPLCAVSEERVQVTCSEFSLTFKKSETWRRDQEKSPFHCAMKKRTAAAAPPQQPAAPNPSLPTVGEKKPVITSATPEQPPQPQPSQPPPPQQPQEPSSSSGGASAIEMMPVAAAPVRKPPPPSPSPNPVAPSTPAPTQQQNGAKRPVPAAPQSATAAGKPPLGLAQKLKAAAVGGGGTAGNGKSNAAFVAESVKDSKDEKSAAKSVGKAGLAGGRAGSAASDAVAASTAGDTAAGKQQAAATETGGGAPATNAGGATDNLRVLGSKDFLSLEDAGVRPTNQNSRRLSTVSQISHFSGGDFSNSANGGLADNADADETGQPRKRFQSNDSYIQEQVPVLPVPAALFVLTLNVLLPGLGTIVSGLLYLCVGPKEHRKVQGFFKPVCINFWVGISQLVTVTFLLVGWFWSMAWGIYAVQKALDLRDELRRKRKQEIAEKALNALMGGGVGSGGEGDVGGGHHTGGLINLLRPR